jgi:hypothetical protein
MRGANTLFKNVFQKQKSEVTKKRKGRSPELHALRNECLVDRYYYYGKFSDKRYTIIIETLSHEFFISPITIPELLSKNYSKIDKLKKQLPAKTYFVKKWPHLRW